MTSPPLQPLDPSRLRTRIADARLMLIFTPELVEDPYAAVASALPHVDVIQVRPKAAGQGGGPSEARACLEATRRVLGLCADLGSNAPVVTVDDRVDVARVLWDEGCAGVHLGRADQPPQDARRVLGPGPLIGLSTHDALQVALADEEKPDLLIDMATLNGAARVALGPDLPPFYCDDEGLVADIVMAAKSTADPLWQMPFWDRYDQWLDSKIADVNHISTGGFAGSLTAALFLRRFVEHARSYVHFDIYGWTPAPLPGVPFGGAAQGIRALYAVIKNRYGKS